MTTKYNKKYKDIAITTGNTCIHDRQRCMMKNKLQVNGDKTELISSSP